MAHKGKTTFDVTYNPEDRPEAYNNPAICSLLSQYTTMAKEVHRPDYDPRTKDIDRGLEDARGMGDTGLPKGQSTRPLLPLCLRCEQGHEREPSHTTLAGQLTTLHPGTPGPTRRREEGTYRDGGEDEGGAGGGADDLLGGLAEDGGDVPIYVEPWRRTRDNWRHRTTLTDRLALR